MQNPNGREAITRQHLQREAVYPYPLAEDHVTKLSTVMRPPAMLPAAEPDEASQPAQNRSRARRHEPQREIEAVRDQHIKAGKQNAVLVPRAPAGALS